MCLLGHCSNLDRCLSGCGAQVSSWIALLIWGHGSVLCHLIDGQVLLSAGPPRNFLVLTSFSFSSASWRNSLPLSSLEIFFSTLKFWISGRFYSGNVSFIVSFYCFSNLSLPCTVPFPLKLLFCVCFDLFYVRVFLWCLIIISCLLMIKSGKL